MGNDLSLPWLSIIMPVHLGEAWVNESLNSVAAQTDVSGIEIIFLDSSPSSICRDIAYSYQNRLLIEVLACPDLVSWQGKTNYGVGVARASHVCWLHQDDLWLENRSLSVRQWIETNPALTLHLAPSAIIDRVGNKLGTWRCPLPASTDLTFDFVRERLLVQNFISAPAPVFRKDAWNAIKGLDETLWYTADWHMWLSLSAIGNIRYHDEVTTAFRIHGSSLTVSGSHDAADFEQQMLTVLNHHLQLNDGIEKSIERIARASIKMNVALASASRGAYDGLFSALHEILKLGPSDIYRYLNYSRLGERVIPRLKAKYKGAL